MFFIRRCFVSLPGMKNLLLLLFALLILVVFGGSAEHTLDALCQRLGIEIPPETRHTALGDALATAQALEKMIPILEARGLKTFAQVRAEVQKHRRILAVEA